MVQTWHSPALNSATIRNMIIRKTLAGAILLISIIVAGYVATPNDGVVREQIEETDQSDSAILRTLDELKRLELAHVIGHVGIFGGVALLLVYPPGSSRLAWRYVLTGAFAMEGVQVIVGASDDYLLPLILGVSFDLLTDFVAAGSAIYIWKKRNISGTSTQVTAAPSSTETDDQSTPGTSSAVSGLSG